jgi:APA family basic amino acid/polyamine antiporter
VLPAVYILLAAVICISLLIYRPLYTWPGLGLVIIGIPLYYILARKNKSRPPVSPGGASQPQ